MRSSGKCHGSLGPVMLDEAPPGGNDSMAGAVSEMRVGRRASEPPPAPTFRGFTAGRRALKGRYFKPVVLGT